MNQTAAEICKAAIVLLLAFLLFDANSSNSALKEENKALKDENRKQLEDFRPDGHNGVLFHLLVSENYRLGGEAKNFLSKDMVIPHDEVNDFLKNGWKHREKFNVPR